MDAKKCNFPVRFFSQERGGVAVEFAIVLPIFLLLVFGIVDFGHAWYMDHVMSNASREGARYGTRYVLVGKVRALPTNLSPSIADYLKNTSVENSGKGGVGLVNLLPPDANVRVEPDGPAWTTTNPNNLAGQDLVVTVTARKTWLVIGYLVPGLGTYKDLSVNTTMKCE